MPRTLALLVLFTNIAVAAPRNVEITAAEAKEHQLTHRVSIDVGGSPFVTSKFGEPGVYLTLSGPPGGPLGMQVLEHAVKHANDAAFRAWVMADQKVKEATKVVTVKLAGRTWRGVAFMLREGLARSVDAYLIDDKGLAIHLDHSAGNKKLADSDVMELVKSKPFDVVLPTLAID